MVVICASLKGISRILLIGQMPLLWKKKTVLLLVFFNFVGGFVDFYFYYILLLLLLLLLFVLIRFPKPRCPLLAQLISLESPH
jgi:hypothetical protein